MINASRKLQTPDHHTRAAKMMDQLSALSINIPSVMRLDVGHLELCTRLLINGVMNTCVSLLLGLELQADS